MVGGGGEKLPPPLTITNYYVFDRNGEKGENEKWEFIFNFIISRLSETRNGENVEKVATATPRFIHDFHVCA